MNENKHSDTTSARTSYDVTVLNQSDNANREVMLRMLETCSKRKESECPVCLILRRKLDLSSASMLAGMQSTIELEQSRIVRLHFPLCTPPPDISRGSLDSTASMGQQALSTDPSMLKFGTGGFPSTVGDASGAERQTRESQLSDPGSKHGCDARALNYGLHNLILEIESDPSQDHRRVFTNMEQSQLHSVLAQITCKDTLFKENETNARLLRIEQELSDLMNREDIARITKDNRHGGTGSVFGGVSVKKINHDHGY